MKTILGFDISSTTTAYCVFQIDNKNIIKIEHGFFKPKKDGSIFERLLKLEENINNILDKYKPDEIAIEDIAQFMQGKSTANTIITLALFNRIVGLTCHKKNLSPTLYNVLRIRHAIKTNKKPPKKEEIPEVLENKLNIKFPYLYDKKGNIKKESYDISDAFAVCLTHAIKSKLI
jgi:crossover junction endodeoxyribonuclease RuvC